MKKLAFLVTAALLLSATAHASDTVNTNNDTDGVKYLGGLGAQTGIQYSVNENYSMELGYRVIETWGSTPMLIQSYRLSLSNCLIRTDVSAR